MVCKLTSKKSFWYFTIVKREKECKQGILGSVVRSEDMLSRHSVSHFRWGKGYHY